MANDPHMRAGRGSPGTIFVPSLGTLTGEVVLTLVDSFVGQFSLRESYRG